MAPTCCASAARCNEPNSATCRTRLRATSTPALKPRVLAVLENFEGWERGADWGDLEFLFSHSHEIAKIAIVGEPRWESDALAFAGAGFRRAPVKFFPAGQETQARAWLAE
jgi:hypothetical protein